MSNLDRVLKYFSKKNIEIVFDNNTYYLHRKDQKNGATLLLPNNLSLEEKAINQLLNFANVYVPNNDEHVCKACATPDFHAGSVVPVGCVVSTTPEMVIPSAIGTDINCGMRLVRTGITLDEFKEKENIVYKQLTNSLLHGQRNIPMSNTGMMHLFNGQMDDLFEEISQNRNLQTGLWNKVNFKQMHEELKNVIAIENMFANSIYAPESMLQQNIYRDPSLGTIGSGNHFVEIQVVNSIINKQKAYELFLKKEEVVFIVHSGSRNVGFYIGQNWMEKAKNSYPQNMKKPSSGLYALIGEDAKNYLYAMGVAAFYALFNRIILSEMVSQVFQEVFKIENPQLIVDIPHNIILQEDDFNIHRKGATPAHNNQLALIPGSMGDFSYLVNGLGNDNWLKSCSHGAGRKIKRQKMWHQNNLNNMSFKCITLKEERVIEEHPSAYKPIGEIISTQEDEGILNSLVEFSPYATFKS